MDKRLNYFKKVYISLNEGEEFCDMCNGKGRVKGTFKVSQYDHPGFDLLCDKCLGDGKLDWIDKITGKKIDFKTRKLRNI